MNLSYLSSGGLGEKKELERDKFETRFTSTYNENQEQIIYDYFRVVPTLRTHKFYLSFTFVLYYYRISKNPVAFEQRPRSRCCSKKSSETESSSIPNNSLPKGNIRLYDYNLK